MVELSSLDVLYLARELAFLEDAYIDRVYEVEPGEFLLRTRHPQRGRGALLVRPGSYACLVAEAPEAPQSPTSLATLLRKHLAGARVRRVDQHEFDRVLLFHLDQRGEPMRLVVELFGKGNLILVGSDDKIRLAQFTQTFKDRTIRRGEPFRFPPARLNPITLSRSEFDQLAERSQRDAVRFLALDLGLGGDLAEELLYRAGVAKDRKTARLSESEREATWKAWQAIIHAPPNPGFARRNADARIEAVPFTAPQFATDERTAAANLSQAITLARDHERKAAPAPVDEERARLERQLEHQRKGIESMRLEAAEWEARAKEGYARYAELQRLLLEAQALAAQGWKELPRLHREGKLPAAIAAVDPATQRLTLRLGERPFPVDPSQSLERNLAAYYEEAKRLRGKQANAEIAVRETEKKLAAAAAPPPVKTGRARPPTKRFWFESYRWCYTSEGFLVVGGRDAASNEKLVKKHLSPGDVYFHADVHGAPSCVLKTEGRPPGEASLREAAQFAAGYSKAFGQFGSADAYWVKPEQVSKTAPTGESVARGAFVVRGSRNPVPRLPMELGVGKVGLGKDGRPAPDGALLRLMGGAPEAVRRWTSQAVRVVRGDRKPTDVARELAQRFGVSADEAAAVLPASTLRVEEGGPVL